MILFPELPSRRFKPSLSFATQADLDSFLSVSRLQRHKAAMEWCDGMDVRITSFVPRGVGVLNTPNGLVMIEIPQGWDANGAPA